MDDPNEQLPAKPSLGAWIEQFLPFRLPRIPLLQTAKNLDIVVGRLVLSVGKNAESRVDASTVKMAREYKAEALLVARAERLLGDSDTLASVDQRAIEYVINDAQRRQSNREQIMRGAVEELASAAIGEDATSEIDEDWLSDFSRLSQEKSSADIQALWSKILATEIRAPGSTSPRTLQFLSIVSSAEAQRIVAAFSYVIDDFFIPAIAVADSIPSAVGGLTYVDAIFLLEMGITTEMPGPTGSQQHMKSLAGDKFEIHIRYGNSLAFFIGENARDELKVRAIPLSQIGKQIYNISDTKVFRQEYWEKLLKKIPETNSFLTKIDVADISGTGAFGLRYHRRREFWVKSPSS